MPWLTPCSNDSNGVLDDWRQPSCVELVEITGLLPAATAGIGGLRKAASAARKVGLAQGCGNSRRFTPDFCTRQAIDRAGLGYRCKNLDFCSVGCSA